MSKVAKDETSCDLGHNPWAEVLELSDSFKEEESSRSSAPSNEAASTKAPSSTTSALRSSVFQTLSTAAESVREPEASLQRDEVAPSPGDTIIHPRKGDCTLLRIGSEAVQIAPTNHRVVTLHPSRISWHYQGIRNQKRVFRFTVKQ